MVLADSKQLIEQITLGPDDTVDGLTRRASDGADGEGFGSLFRGAVVAFRQALADGLDLAIEAGGATLDQRYVGSKAHAVDMAASVEVVEGVEDDNETAEPVDIELWVFDVCVMCLDLDIRVELGGGLAGDQSLGLLDVCMTEEELAVEVGQVDCVEVDDMDLAKAGADEVLEEFAADATSADDQDARILDVGELRAERLLEESFARHGAVWMCC